MTLWLENATPATQKDALFLIKSKLLESGTREVRCSGSGSGGVYAQVGDVISSAADLGNAGAWFVMKGVAFQDGPDTIRSEICYQTDGSGGVRAKISPRAGFSGGSPSATRVPSATDERVWFGGGTDASPSYDTLFPSEGTYRMQGGVQDYRDRSWFMCYPIGGGTTGMLLLEDMPQNLAEDTSGMLVDKCPQVYFKMNSANAFFVAGITSDLTAPFSVQNLGRPGELWARCSATFSVSYDSAGNMSRVYPGYMTSSPDYVTPSYPEEFIRYGRRSSLVGTTISGEVGNNTTSGDKGYSSTIRWSAQRQATPVLLDAYDPSSGLVCKGAKLAIGDMVFSWSGKALLV